MIAGLLLFAAAVAYRLLPVLLGVKLQQPEWLPNFSPMAALCLCGAAFLPRRLAIVVPFAALFGTDVVLNAHFGFALFTIEFVGKTVAFAAVIALGWKLRKNARPRRDFPRSARRLALFLHRDEHRVVAPRTRLRKVCRRLVAGADDGPASIRSSSGRRGPSYRNSLVSDLLFTAIFLACMHWSRKPASAAVMQPAEAIR